MTLEEFIKSKGSFETAAGVLGVTTQTLSKTWLKLKKEPKSNAHKIILTDNKINSWWG